MQTFINQTGDSNKFWTITQLENTYTVTWGKIGAEGRVNTKEFSDSTECTKEIERLILAKATTKLLTRHKFLLSQYKITYQ